MISVVWRTALLAGSLLLAAGLHAQQQIVDTNFKAVVEKPAYPERGPDVALDEAHSNFHTAAGRYRPFAELLKSDGYDVLPSTRKFSDDSFDGIDVLIIANARGSDSSNPFAAAFTDTECRAVANWVRNGGSLLLIADHAPFGSATENLAREFGVLMGKGWAFDRASAGAITTQLTFSRENGLLGTHWILNGRTAAEEVRVIRTFTGQSLGVPQGGAVLMPFSATAREAAMPDDLDAEAEAAPKSDVPGSSFGTRSAPIAGRAQGIAMTVGRGRVVVLGEAGLLSAQVIRFPDGREMKMGMNVPGNDNRQFALNVMHWLSRLLE